VRKSAAELRAIWVAGNEFLQSAAPWSTFKTDPDTAAADTRLALNLIRIYAILSQPFIPDASIKMLDAIGTQETIWPGAMDAALTRLKPGHKFTVPDVLFQKITDEQREEWEVSFAGTRD
jgi:methionyl-tRNA synthetase